MTSPVGYELQAKIANWRQRAATGDLTQEEMKEAIILLRAGRVSSATSAPAAKRKKAIAAIPAADDMLSDIENM